MISEKTLTMIEEYDKYVATHPLVEKFSICKKNKTRNEVEILHLHNFDQNEILSMNGLCVFSKSSYLCCIDFYNHVECEVVTRQKKGVAIESRKSHICDIFPVMLGSQLDRQFCIERFGTYQNEFSTLGLYIFDGALTIVPILLTNRKELYHRTKDGSLCIYVYDKLDRGYRISLVNDSIFYRDRHGQDVAEFPSDADLFVDFRHLNFQLMKEAGHRLWLEEPRSIDDFENKLTQKPINIYDRVFNMARKRVNQAQVNISRGLLEKFVSANISFSSYQKPKYFGDNRGSCNLRKIPPNQLARGGFHNLIIKPMGTNVATSVIERSEYFICAIEKNVSIDAFNRSMSALSNSYVCSEMDFRERDINHLFDWLYQNGHIVDFDKEKTMILCNGGLPTRYSTNLQPMELYRAVKTFHK